MNKVTLARQFPLASASSFPLAGFFGFYDGGKKGLPFRHISGPTVDGCGRGSGFPRLNDTR